MATQGINIEGERPIDYGYQLSLSLAGERASVSLYTTGKTLVQGKPGRLHDLLTRWKGSPPGGSAAAPAVRATLETTPGLLAPLPHIGADESGKGDYFGPLVVAAVAIDQHSAARLAALGVRDSKALGDVQIRQLAAETRACCPHQVLVLLPEEYNRRYVELGSNLNKLLAWAHAACIGELLARAPVGHVLVDQFAAPTVLAAALRDAGVQATLLQRPRAEADLAVAAASLLARDAFVATLERLGREAGVRLPLGASDTGAILAAARRVVATAGPEGLGRVAKVHFKTTQQVIKQ